MTNLTAEQVIERARFLGMVYLTKRKDGIWKFRFSKPVWAEHFIYVEHIEDGRCSDLIARALASGARFEELGEMG